MNTLKQTIDVHLMWLRQEVAKVSDSREKSLALTKLDEFEMWLARCNMTGTASDDLVTVTRHPQLLEWREFTDIVGGNPRAIVSRDGAGNFSVKVETDPANRQWTEYLAKNIHEMPHQEAAWFVRAMEELLK